MSEKPKKEEGGKKKGKMPMILALVVMLGAGGFFGMKMGGGQKKEEPKIELGETEKLGEFLVNLSDGHSFLKTEISVQLAKKGHLEEEGGKKKEGEAEPPAPVRDAIIAVLSSKSIEEISTPEGKLQLKKELAAAINAVAPKEEEKEKDKDKEKEKKAHKSSKKKKGDEDEEEVVDETWDSQTGPVLKVFFTSFATQQ